MNPTENTEQIQEINEAAEKQPPTIEQLQAELRHEKYKRSFVFSLRNTIFTLVTVAAAAVLIAVLLMPVLQIYGSSMTPTLSEGEIVVSVKGTKMKTGDIVAFYYNNNVLIKRVIAQPGDWVNITEDGTVFVNNEAIDEPYLTEKAFGECNIQLPYQVPDSRIFVMGDHRSVSIDSRNTAVGCVADEQIVGKIVFRVWPLSQFGRVA
jgi:signal peptidase I